MVDSLSGAHGANVTNYAGMVHNGDTRPARTLYPNVEENPAIHHRKLKKDLATPAQVHNLTH